MILISNKINLHAYLNQPVPERMHDILADRTCVNRAILHYTTKKKQSLSVQQLQKTTKIPGLNLLFTVELIQSMWVWHAFDTTELYTC